MRDVTRWIEQHAGAVGAVGLALVLLSLALLPNAATISPKTFETLLVFVFVTGVIGVIALISRRSIGGRARMLAREMRALERDAEIAALAQLRRGESANNDEHHGLRAETEAEFLNHLRPELMAITSELRHRAGIVHVMPEEFVPGIDSPELVGTYPLHRIADYIERLANE